MGQLILVTEHNVDMFSAGDSNAKVTINNDNEVGERREGDELKERVIISS